MKRITLSTSELRTPGALVTSVVSGSRRCYGSDLGYGLDQDQGYGLEGWVETSIAVPSTSVTLRRRALVRGRQSDRGKILPHLGELPRN